MIGICFSNTIVISDINECASDPCVHGTCDDEVNGYHCECDDGYEGGNCHEGKPRFLMSGTLIFGNKTNKSSSTHSKLCTC